MADSPLNKSHNSLTNTLTGTASQSPHSTAPPSRMESQAKLRIQPQPEISAPAALVSAQSPSGDKVLHMPIDKEPMLTSGYGSFSTSPRIKQANKEAFMKQQRKARLLQEEAEDLLASPDSGSEGTEEPEEEYGSVGSKRRLRRVNPAHRNELTRTEKMEALIQKPEVARKAKSSNAEDAEALTLIDPNKVMQLNGTPFDEDALRLVPNMSTEQLMAIVALKRKTKNVALMQRARRLKRTMMVLVLQIQTMFLHKLIQAMTQGRAQRTLGKLLRPIFLRQRLQQARMRRRHKECPDLPRPNLSMIRNVPLFAELAPFPGLLDKLVAVMEPSTFDINEHIIRQGECSSNLFVVAKGSCVERATVKLRHTHANKALMNSTSKRPSEDASQINSPRVRQLTLSAPAPWASPPTIGLSAANNTSSRATPKADVPLDPEDPGSVRFDLMTSSTNIASSNPVPLMRVGGPGSFRTLGGGAGSSNLTSPNMSRAGSTVQMMSADRKEGAPSIGGGGVVTVTAPPNPQPANSNQFLGQVYEEGAVFGDIFGVPIAHVCSVVASAPSVVCWRLTKYSFDEVMSGDSIPDSARAIVRRAYLRHCLLTMPIAFAVHRSVTALNKIPLFDRISDKLSLRARFTPISGPSVGRSASNLSTAVVPALGRSINMSQVSYGSYNAASTNTIAPLNLSINRPPVAATAASSTSPTTRGRFQSIIDQPPDVLGLMTTPSPPISTAPTPSVMPSLLIASPTAPSFALPTSRAGLGTSARRATISFGAIGPLSGSTSATAQTQHMQQSQQQTPTIRDNVFGSPLEKGFLPPESQQQTPQSSAPSAMTPRTPAADRGAPPTTPFSPRRRSSAGLNNSQLATPHVGAPPTKGLGIVRKLAEGAGYTIDGLELGCLTPVLFTSGDVLFWEGRRSEHVYLLLAGEVLLTQEPVTAWDVDRGIRRGSPSPPAGLPFVGGVHGATDMFADRPPTTPLKAMQFYASTVRQLKEQDLTTQRHSISQQPSGQFRLSPQQRALSVCAPSYTATSPQQAPAGPQGYVWLGHHSPLLQMPHSHSCRVVSDTAKVYAIKKLDFIEAIVDETGLLSSIREEMLRARASKLPRLLKARPEWLNYVPLFHFIPINRRRLLVRSAIPFCYLADTPITTKLSPVTHIYIIASGSVRTDAEVGNSMLKEPPRAGWIEAPPPFASDTHFYAEGESEEDEEDGGRSFFEAGDNMTTVSPSKPVNKSPNRVLDQAKTEEPTTAALARRRESRKPALPPRPVAHKPTPKSQADIFALTARTAALMNSKRTAGKANAEIPVVSGDLDVDAPSKHLKYPPTLEWLQARTAVEFKIPAGTMASAAAEAEAAGEALRGRRVRSPPSYQKQIGNANSGALRHSPPPQSTTPTTVQGSPPSPSKRRQSSYISSADVATLQSSPSGGGYSAIPPALSASIFMSNSGYYGQGRLSDADAPLTQSQVRGKQLQQLIKEQQDMKDEKERATRLKRKELEFTQSAQPVKYVIGGSWEGLVSDQWSATTEAATLVEGWMIPVSVVKRVYSALPAPNQHKMLLYARACQKEDLKLEEEISAPLKGMVKEPTASPPPDAAADANEATARFKSSRLSPTKRKDALPSGAKSPQGGKSPMRKIAGQEVTNDPLDTTGSFYDANYTSFVDVSPSFTDMIPKKGASLDQHPASALAPINTSTDSGNGTSQLMATSIAKRIPSNIVPTVAASSTSSSLNPPPPPSGADQPQRSASQQSFHNYTHFQTHQAQLQKAMATGNKALFSEKSTLQTATEQDLRISAQKGSEVLYAVRKELINPSDGLLNPQAMLDSIAKERTLATKKIEQEAKRRAAAKAEAERQELKARTAHLKGARPGGRFGGRGSDESQAAEGTTKGSSKRRQQRKSPIRVISPITGKVVHGTNATVMLDTEWRRIRLEAKDEAKRINEMYRKPKLHEDDNDGDFGDISGMGRQEGDGEDTKLIKDTQKGRARTESARKEHEDTNRRFQHRFDIPSPTEAQKQKHLAKELADEELYEQHVADVELDLPHNANNRSTPTSGAKRRGNSPERFRPEQAFHKMLLAAALGRPKNIVTGFDDRGREIVEHRTGGGLGAEVALGSPTAAAKDRLPATTVITDRDRYSDFRDALGGLRIAVVEAKATSASLQHDTSAAPVGLKVAKLVVHIPSQPLSGPLPEVLQPVMNAPLSQRPSTAAKSASFLPQSTDTRPGTAKHIPTASLLDSLTASYHGQKPANTFVSSPRNNRGTVSSTLNGSPSPAPTRPKTASLNLPLALPAFGAAPLGMASQTRGGSASPRAHVPGAPNSARPKPPRHSLMAQLQQHQQAQSRGGGSLSAR